MRSAFSLATILIYVVCLLSMGTSELHADDWPTHLHDNERTGHSSETLDLPLSVLWKVQLPQPRPAWPLPAKQDYWNRKTNLRPRVVHDRGNGIVVSDGRLVVGSSADDQVRAFDTKTGRLLWNAFAEGPIRLAPTIWKTKAGSSSLVVFASDDGFVYGVDLESGKKKWQTRPSEIGSRRIPGNGRIISERPIRSGVMIKDDGTGYFAAGIFPLQGAHFFSLDVRTGKILDAAKIEKSVQGYLELRDGRIFAPTGRDPHGVTLRGTHTKQAQVASSPRADDSFSHISDGEHEYFGRENEVVARANQGEILHEIWRANVDGRVYAMAIADGQLFVSTDTGAIYAFGSKPRVASHDSIVPIKPTNLDVDSFKHTRGYSLYVEPSSSQIEALMRRTSQSESQVVISVADPDHASRIRTQLTSSAVYGSIVVHVAAPSKPGSPNALPYAEKIFEDVIVGESLNASDYDSLKTPNRLQAGTGWSHAYGGPGNQASTTERVGGAPMQLQWFGGPGPRNMVDRHMRTMPPLASGGRMFIPGLNRVIAVNSYNGAVQWEHEIPNSTRIGMLKDCGWMVADDDSLMVVVQDRLLRVGSENGKVTEAEIARVPTPNRSWGFLAVVGENIIGSSTLLGSHRQTISREAILEGAYSDHRPVVCSDELFSFLKNSATSTQLEWKLKSRGSILNPTIAANDTRAFFVESDLALDATPTGRILLEEFLSHNAKLVAVNLATGERDWSVDLPKIPGAQNAFVLCDDERVVLVNSRNDTTVFYDIRAFGSKKGEELWSTTQDNKKRPGGDHGEQDKHPVIVGSRLIVEPFGYDLDTGSRLTELDLSKRGYGCGTISASAEAIFFRSGNPASYSLKTNKLGPLTSVSRPSCWINMIPADGMLLIPEGSSGCTCNYAVQTSMAFVPN